MTIWVHSRGTIKRQSKVLKIFQFVPEKWMNRPTLPSLNHLGFFSLLVEIVFSDYYLCSHIGHHNEYPTVCKDTRHCCGVDTRFSCRILIIASKQVSPQVLNSAADVARIFQFHSCVHYTLGLIWGHCDIGTQQTKHDNSVNVACI